MCRYLSCHATIMIYMHVQMDSWKTASLLQQPTHGATRSPFSQSPTRHSPKILPRRYTHCRPELLHLPPISPSPPHRSPSSFAHWMQQPQPSMYWRLSSHGTDGQADWLQGGQPQPNCPGTGKKENAVGKRRRKAAESMTNATTGSRNCHIIFNNRSACHNYISSHAYFCACVFIRMVSKS